MYEKNELVLDTRELCGKIEDLILVDVFKAPESFESLKDLINAYRDQVMNFSIECIMHQ